MSITKVGASQPRFVLALDVGTSSVRAILHDLRGRPSRDAAVHLRYRVRIRADGMAEIDADQLAGLVVRSLGLVLRLAGPRRSRVIAGVAMSTFWHGIVAADDSARALTPVYLWADSRSSTASAQLISQLDAERVRIDTGCPIHPSYWPAKLAWLRTERGDLWKGPVRWLSFSDLLYWRLFGRLGTSLSMASATGLFRLLECRWDDELLAKLRMSRESLPRITEVEQDLVPRYARLWPALAKVPWLHAIGDGALANLGSGCLTTDRRALSIGTSGAMRVMHTALNSSLPPGLWSYRLDAKRFVTGGALSNGGNLRDWLLYTLRLPDKNLDGELSRKLPGAHGLTFMPHLAGERSLGYAPDAHGAIVGLASATTPKEIATAGLEAVAVEFARVDRRMDQLLPRAKLIVASGAALLNSPAWMQAMADATGHTVAPSRASEASSRGAAVFAIEALGLGQAARLDPGIGRILKPRLAHSRAYRDVEAHQEALYNSLIKAQIPQGTAER